MKKFCLKLLFTIVTIILSITSSHAVQFDVLALPTDLYSVCDNYFCFPETSEIAVNYIITNLSGYGTINIKTLPQVRAALEFKPELKAQTLEMLSKYKNTDKIDFNILDNLSKEFGVKSIILVSTYTTSEKTPVKRNLWEILELSSAFRTSHPYNLITNVVLTDTVNNVIMWSAKFNKQVSNTEGYFCAQNQAQAASQLEKIKLYYKDNVSNSVSSNIYLRFFPQDVRTFKVKKQEGEEDTAPHFVPNALDHLIQPKTIKEIEGVENTLDTTDDLMFDF